MKLKVFLSLPLRLPILKICAGFARYCPYTGTACGVNWINAPIDCKDDCSVRNPKSKTDYSYTEEAG